MLPHLFFGIVVLFFNLLLIAFSSLRSGSQGLQRKTFRIFAAVPFCTLNYPHFLLICVMFNWPCIEKLWVKLPFKASIICVMDRFYRTVIKEVLNIC